MTNLKQVFNRIETDLMELILFPLIIIIVFYYLFRPTSKEEEDHFNSKNNWRGGF